MASSSIFSEFANSIMEAVDVINGVIWADWVLYTVLAVGVLFTIWSGFCQYRALTHGTAVTAGKYDDPDDPGAINHFQALSAALSATVGLGNIGGVALAIALGGPGAVFWMWVVGLAGMALKTTSVTLSMLSRNIDDPNNPHGGPMYVAQRGFEAWGLKPIGTIIGIIFCITLLISAITGGNMFQAWNVGMQTQEAIGMPPVAVGIVLAVIVALVIIGGIKRIGNVAGVLVPVMCVIYLAAGSIVLLMNLGALPGIFVLIFKSAFSPHEASGAFLGGTAGYAFLWGMKRALFSSEAGQGSSPIAHSAAKTKEPVREAVVAGLEPFIDTIIVCTLTALVILSTGAWDRGGKGETLLAETPAFMQAPDGEDGETLWNCGTFGVIPGDTAENPKESFFVALPSKNDESQTTTGKDWRHGDNIFMVLETSSANGEADEKTGSQPKHVLEEEKRFKKTGSHRKHVQAEVVKHGNLFFARFDDTIASATQPTFLSNDVFKNYPGATLTAHAFDRAIPGLGTWLVLLASWLFAISTMISWSYYGEQGMIFIFGNWSILPYKLFYCVMIIISTLPFIETDAQLDGLTALGTGVMLWANIPIMLIFGLVAMRAYHSYVRRLKAGEFKSHEARNIDDMARE